MSLTFILTFWLGAISVGMFPIALWLLSAQSAVLVEWQITWLGSAPLCLTIVLDFLPIVFMSVICLISSSVVQFAGGYMQNEVHLHRFLHQILGFVLSMIIFVFSSNLVVLLLGWDGLGLISYLLVVYYQTPRSLGCGMLVALTNRLGDVGILLAIGLSMGGGQWSLFSISLDWVALAAAGLAGLTKSAQFPFSAWLPAAMAAPTPVSALVHSSTLVTAGVYLLIRLYGSIEVMSWGPPTLLLVGVVTMLMAGLSAMSETDAKKVVALSTLSQLGVMFCALGLHSPQLAFFHLLTHAMFKALLFICVGTYIFYHGHDQDLRSMGNLANHLPVTQTAASIANLALAGFPFLAAFYSKESIFEAGITGSSSLLFPTLFSFGALLTAAYSTRMVVVTQLGPNCQPPLSCFHNESKMFVFPTLFLSLGAISWGATLNWILLPALPSFSLGWLSNSAPVLGALTGVICVSALILAAQLKESGQETAFVVGGSVSSSLWFLNGLSTQPIVSGSMSLGAKMLMSVEQGWLEGSTAGGTQYLAKKAVQTMQPLQHEAPPILLLMALFAFTPLVLLVLL